MAPSRRRDRTRDGHPGPGRGGCRGEEEPAGRARARKREVVTVEIAAPGSAAANYAFDVTPNEFVDAIITEKGVARKPYTESLRKMAEE